MESGVVQVCRAWKVTVRWRYLKRRTCLYRVVQMALLGSVLAFLKASHESSGQITFLLAVTCLVLVTVILVFIINLLPLHCIMQHHHCCHHYNLASIMETVHDGVSCIVLLPAALLLLLPQTPNTSIAVAAVLTVVLVLLLGLHCVENLHRACLPNSSPQEHQGEEEETLPCQDLHTLPTRRYTPNARIGRSKQWSKHRKHTISSPIPLLHTSKPHNSPFLSQGRSSPLLHSAHPSMSHPNSPCPSNSRFSPHPAVYSGVSLTQDVVLTDIYMDPSDAMDPSDVDTPSTCPSPALTHTPGPSPSPSHNPSLTSTTLAQVNVKPVYTVPASTHTTTYITPNSASDSINHSPIYENLPGITTTTTNPTTTTYDTSYSPSDHNPVYENLPAFTTTTCDDHNSPDNYYSPVSYL